LVSQFRVTAAISTAAEIQLEELSREGCKLLMQEVSGAQRAITAPACQQDFLY